MDEELNPSITHALEALLGGLDSNEMATTVADIAANETTNLSSANGRESESLESSTNHDILMQEKSHRENEGSVSQIMEEQLPPEPSRVAHEVTLSPSAMLKEKVSESASESTDIVMEEQSVHIANNVQGSISRLSENMDIGIDSTYVNAPEAREPSPKSSNAQTTIISEVISQSSDFDAGRQRTQEPIAPVDESVKGENIQIVNELSDMKSTSNTSSDHQLSDDQPATAQLPHEAAKIAIPGLTSLVNGTSGLSEPDVNSKPLTAAHNHVPLELSVMEHVSNVSEEHSQSFPDSSISSAVEDTQSALHPVPVAAANIDSIIVGGDKGVHPEWELDSSPIESSSDDSSRSGDSSSDESDEGDNAYKLLSPEEQAKILMQGDGDSEDEGGGKAKGTGGPLRTKNEVLDVVIPKPDVVIDENMTIVELGAVEQIVDQILLIKGKTSGEYRVLESGSVLCLADRTVIGAVSETIGRVQQPFYSVLFTNATELKATGLSHGVQIYYSEQHSTFVFTQALKAYKGSDASNLHDEEVGDEEMEFSDDDAEMEHKKRVKQRKQERRGGKAQQNGTSRRGGHPLQEQHGPYDPSQGISYDDTDDGPYKPLTRPVGYENTVGRREAPQEAAYSKPQSFTQEQGRGSFRGRGRGDRGRGDRGRGDRSRGRGDRGRDRGAFPDGRNSSGFSLPPQTQSSPGFQPAQSQTPFSQSPFQSQTFPQLATATNYYNNPPATQYSSQQAPFTGWPQIQQPAYQANQHHPQSSTQHHWPNAPHVPVLPPQGMPGGAFINPAFFNQHAQPGYPAQWAQQDQRGGRGAGGTR